MVGFARTAHLELQQHVVERAAPGQQHRSLEHDPEIGHRSLDPRTIDRDRPLCGPQQSTDQHQQRRFSAAGGADDRNEFARPDLQPDAVEGLGRTPACLEHVRDIRHFDCATAPAALLRLRLPNVDHDHTAAATKRRAAATSGLRFKRWGGRKDALELDHPFAGARVAASNHGFERLVVDDHDHGAGFRIVTGRCMLWGSIASISPACAGTSRVMRRPGKSPDCSAASGS